MIKSIVIARKDLKQSFRSAFALAFMFAIPLLITTMFYLMFGSQSAQPEAAFQPPVTRVVVANLDKGDALLAKEPVAELAGWRKILFGGAES